MPPSRTTFGNSSSSLPTWWSTLRAPPAVLPALAASTHQRDGGRLYREGVQPSWRRCLRSKQGRYSARTLASHRWSLARSHRGGRLFRPHASTSNNPLDVSNASSLSLSPLPVVPDLAQLLSASARLGTSPLPVSFSSCKLSHFVVNPVSLLQTRYVRIAVEEEEEVQRCSCTRSDSGRRFSWIGSQSFLNAATAVDVSRGSDREVSFGFEVRLTAVYVARIHFVCQESHVFDCTCASMCASELLLRTRRRVGVSDRRADLGEVLLAVVSTLELEELFRRELDELDLRSIGETKRCRK